MMLQQSNNNMDKNNNQTRNPNSTRILSYTMTLFLSCLLVLIAVPSADAGLPTRSMTTENINNRMNVPSISFIQKQLESLSSTRRTLQSDESLEESDEEDDVVPMASKDASKTQVYSSTVKGKKGSTSAPTKSPAPSSPPAIKGGKTKKGKTKKGSKDGSTTSEGTSSAVSGGGGSGSSNGSSSGGGYSGFNGYELVFAAVLNEFKYSNDPVGLGTKFAFSGSLATDEDGEIGQISGTCTVTSDINIDLTTCDMFGRIITPGDDDGGQHGTGVFAVTGPTDTMGGHLLVKGSELDFAGSRGGTLSLVFDPAGNPIFYMMLSLE